MARGGREPGGQGGTATWKKFDVNHLAWAECGLQRGEEQETGKRPWWAGRWRVGLGVARPRGPYLPDCCSPDAFTATAWPIQPADLIPSSPPLQAPLCLPRRLKALAASSSGERKSRTQQKGYESLELCQVRQNWGSCCIPCAPDHSGPQFPLPKHAASKWRGARQRSELEWARTKGCH